MLSELEYYGVEGVKAENIDDNVMKLQQCVHMQKQVNELKELLTRSVSKSKRHSATLQFAKKCIDYAWKSEEKISQNDAISISHCPAFK